MALESFAAVMRALHAEPLVRSLERQVLAWQGKTSAIETPGAFMPVHDLPEASLR